MRSPNLLARRLGKLFQKDIPSKIVVTLSRMSGPKHSGEGGRDEGTILARVMPLPQSANLT